LKITRRLRISGLVQGVFFRESMRQRARQLKLTGWVRNRSDGTVEAVVQGESTQVEMLIDWARRGPGAALVDRVEVKAADDEPDYTSFDKKPST
jgi:acylphosphatase